MNNGKITLKNRNNSLCEKTALRDHLIVQNGYKFDIKKGDDLSNIPEVFYDTLKTEKVIRD